MLLNSTYLYLLLFSIISFEKVANCQTLQVTINKKVGQESRNISPVVFTVVFSAPINITSFSAAAITLSGTASGKTITAITQVSPNDGTTFEITVSAASNDGTVMAVIPAAASSYTSINLGTTGSHPQGIAIDGSGNVFTANSGSNNVSKITAAGVSSILGLTGSHPYGIIINADGDLFTANSYDGSITKLTPLGVSSLFAATGSHPYAINIDAAGNLYVANSYASTLSKITSAGVSTTPFGATGSSPYDLTIDASGNVYVANYGDNTISKITAGGVSTTLGTTGNGPDGITIDASGNLYTANLYDNTVTMITAAGATSLFGTTGNGPTAITIDAADNIYTANGSSGNVSKISPAGISTIIGTTGNNPVSITIDASGNIYTANNSNNTVSKLIPSGISIFGSTTPSNAASTSTNNIYVLPVNLVYFTVINKNCSAVLSWQSAAEINSSYYGIETSKDGAIFTEVVRLATNNSVNGATYAYSFNEIAIGTIYYRLKMVNTDGHYTYSKIIVIKANENCIVSGQQTVSPNPVNDFVTVKGLVNGDHLTLMNSAGTILSSIEVRSSQQRLNISQYASGVYLLLMETPDGNTHSVKIIKK